MIGSILKIGAALAGLAQEALAYFRKKDDQNTGRKLQSLDDANKVISDVQAANGGAGSPDVLDFVRRKNAANGK